MKRRNFLKYTTTTAAAMPILVNGMPVRALAKSSIFNLVNGESDKVLVLIQLNGGNDGLNTILPLDQYSNLSNARSNILIPESSALNVQDGVGMHPNMTGMKSLFDDAKLNIIQSVGYPGQNRSHFRSTDIWTSGSPANENWTTGWLGRHFEANHPAYPEGYPSEDCPDPFALTMGSSVSETCQGTNGNFSLALNDPFSLMDLTVGQGGEVPDNYYGEELDWLRTLIAQTNAYSDTITGAAEMGNNMLDYPEDNNLAGQLKNVARLIAGGLQTKVYVCSLGGFDTHANQIADSPLVGDHANLLQTLSDAVSIFQQDIEALGLGERVVGMTFSEFGRRIRSNVSLGTDHGSAAPLMVFGKCVNAGIMGINPEIPVEVGEQDGVPMQYDFRNIYGSILMDWFEVGEEDVRNLLFNDFQYLPVLTPCETVGTNNIQLQDLDTWNAPNPFQTNTTIYFTCAQEHVRLSVFNMLGHELAVLIDKTLPAGEHTIAYDAKNLPTGNYFYRLQLESGAQATKVMIKIH